MPMRSRARTRRWLDSVQSATANIPRSREKQAVSHSKKSVQNRFRIGAGVESVSKSFQFDAQFRVIVDFAIENDDRVAVI